MLASVAVGVEATSGYLPADNNKEWSFVRESGKMEGEMSKVDAKAWSSLIWTESPVKDSFRLADLTQARPDKTEKISSEAPHTEPQQNDSFEMVDAGRRLYIKSLLG